jgi:hypothetical protein
MMGYGNFAHNWCTLVGSSLVPSVGPCGGL